MEKSGIKAFLLSAVIVGYRILVGDERFLFGAAWMPPIWLRHLIVFVVLFALLFLDFWLLDRWKEHREKKKMEQYMDGRS